MHQVVHPPRFAPKITPPPKKNKKLKINRQQHNTQHHLKMKTQQHHHHHPKSKPPAAASADLFMAAAARSAAGEVWDRGGGEGGRGSQDPPSGNATAFTSAGSGHGSTMQAPLSLEKLGGKGMREGVEDRRIHPSKMPLLPPPLDPPM